MVGLLDFAFTIVMAEKLSRLSDAAADRAYTIYLKLFSEKFVRTVTVIKSVEELSSMERPCNNCHSYDLCKEDGYECSHFKAWVTKGKYDPKSCSWK